MNRLAMLAGRFFLFLSCAVFFAAGRSAAAGSRSSQYGHFKYPEARASQLTDAGTYRATGRAVKLRVEAARAFRAMAEAARADGFQLIPISGFRSVSYQKGLFQRSVKKNGSAREAAKWVAPPGHSEHHTGWTLDLGDAERPAADVDVSFEDTPLYGWLQKNAARFDFELSFPKGNSQGVSFEPWHWRYVGTDESRRLFYPE